MSDMTLDEAIAHSATKEYARTESGGYLRVRPYGNCTLINGLAKSSQIKLGNIATEAQGKVLRVNVENLR